MMRAAAGADLGEIDGRHLEQVAGAGEQARAAHDAAADAVLERRACTSPPSISDALAVVPPMSKVMMSGEPELARQRLRADHAAGRARLDDVRRHARRVLGAWSGRHWTASAAAARRCRPLSSSRRSERR